MTGSNQRASIWFACALLAASAPAAANGNVAISSAATQNMNCTNGVCAPTASKAVLNVTDLETLLAAGNVEVTTVGLAVQANSLMIDAPLTWSSDSKLALDAYQSIHVAKPITVSGSGSVFITTDDGSTGGTFSFGQKGNITFPGTTNTLVINGSQYTLVATLPALASAIAADPSGAYALANSYDAGQDGTYHSSPITTIFEGNFNALGNTISHLKIKGRASSQELALFSELDSLSSVASLRMSRADVVSTGSYSGFAVATLVGANLGTVSNSSVDGSISVVTRGLGLFGGLAGINNGGVLDDVASYVSIKLTTRGADSSLIGGLVGFNGEGTIDQSYATGSIVVSDEQGGQSVGGLLGSNAGTVTNCFASGSTTESGAGHAYAEALSVTIVRPSPHHTQREPPRQGRTATSVG